MSHSQAPFCLCTLQLISVQFEGTFARLRYLLGGDRPSQITYLKLSLFLNLKDEVSILILPEWYLKFGSFFTE